MLELKRLIKASSIDGAAGAPAQLDAAFLSTIVCIVSLNVLERNGCLKNLRSNSGDLAFLDNGQISELVQILYEKAKALAPTSVRNVMPAPHSLTSKQLKAFRQFLKATENFQLFSNECVIGNAYQLCSQLRRKEALKQVQSSNKEIDAQSLISFTQLYTPQWVVDTLIAQALAKSGAADINVIDPACGAGNFLLPAFDSLLKLLRAGGMSETEAVHLLSQGALSGVDLDPHGIWITTLALTVRCLRLSEPMCVPFLGIQLLEKNGSQENLLGTLDRNFDLIGGHPLSRRYTAVLTNPPYIGRKLLSRDLKLQLRKHYPDDSHDISVAFTRRCLELLKKDGRLGLITQSSILYLPSSKEFREKLIEDFHPILAIEAGTGVFPLQSGEKIDSVIMVIERKQDSQNADCLFINLRKEEDKASALKTVLENSDSHPLSFKRTITSFKRFPNCQFNYSCPGAAVTLFEKLPPLGKFAEVRQGLATTDNERFVRYVWDVPVEEIGTIWFPYVKGAGSQRWYSPVLNVVKWQDDGREIKEAVTKAYPYLKGKVHWVVKNEKYYFQEGLSFSFVNNANFAVRLLPAGCIFDVAASALFPTKIDRYALLAFLNSSFAAKMAHLINPTINFQVGDVKRLPFVEFSPSELESLKQLAQTCVQATESISKQRDFHVHQLLQPVMETAPAAGALEPAYEEHCAAIRQYAQLIAETEREIDALVLDSLKVKNILTASEFDELESWIKAGEGNSRAGVQALSPQEFAEQWHNSSSSRALFRSHP